MNLCDCAWLGYGFDLLGDFRRQNWDVEIFS